MDLGIHGKVAMVAAGSKGIGRATAELLAREGARVSVCARGEAALAEAVEAIGNGAIGTVCDVTQEAEIARWFAETETKLGSPDILMTNTGGPPAGLWTEMTDAQWQSGFESTLLNVVRMVRLAAPKMQAKGWGRIVHLTSVVAKEPVPLLPISATLRAGIMALTRLQATELAPYGITVNGVLPGHTLTDRQIHLAEVRAGREGISVEAALDLQAQHSPMNRLGKPEEIAAGVAFLCSEPAAFITGVSLLADGGIVKAPG